MSLSVKQLSLVLFFATATFMAACDDPKEIGLPQGQSLGVVFTDEVTVQTSTVLVDSVISSSSAYFLVGKYSDPQMGALTSSSYFQPYYTSDTASLNLGVTPLTLDSAVLFLNYSYYYGDTNQVNTLSVHKLQDVLQGKLRYTREKLDYNSAVAGSKTFKPLPVSADTLKIKLSNDLGQELLSYQGKSESNFLSTFPGLALVPGSNDGSVIGYFTGTSSRIRLYYQSEGAAKTYDFTLTAPQSNRRFNYIEGNRQGTAIASLQNAYDEVPSAQSNQETYVQAGTGIMTKVEFTDMSKLLTLGDIAINKAELIVSSVSNTALRLPPRLILYDIAQNSITQQDVIKRDIFGYPEYTQETPFDFINLPLANLTNSTYSFIITEYVARIFQSLRTNQVPNQKLFLSIPSIALDRQINQNTSFVTPDISLEDNVSRVAIGSQQHPTQPLKLKIYYTPLSAN